MKLTNTIRDAFIRRVMSDVPSVDYSEQIRSAAVKAAVNLLPSKVRAIYADADLRHYVGTFWCYEGVGLSLPGVDENKKASKAIKEAVAPLLELQKAQEAQREQLIRKLRGCAYATTTRKALAEMLPEFAQYLPEDEAEVNRSLPAVANVVSEFVKAGWPKGKKAAAKKQAA